MTTATTSPTPLAFSPGSVTCFFVPNVGTTLEDTSAPGCGICIADGVTAAIRPAAAVRVRFNGRDIDFPPVRSVIEALAPEPVEVILETPLPIGCGFGVSAASSLTTAFALARRFSIEKTRWELGEVALRAEIRHRTGIGDPVTQLTGGIVLRRWQKGPFDALSLKLASAQSLCYRVFGPLSTKEVLSNPDLVRRLAIEGQCALDWLEENHQHVTLGQLLERSLEFADRSGLVTDARVIQAIADVRRSHGQAAMVMLGQSVMAERLPLDPTGWRECRIDPEGTRFLP